MAKIGYMRVSTESQTPEDQLKGLELDEVFIEKKSGKNTDRPKLKECIKYIRKGDILYVKSMCRLARSLADLNQLVNQIVDKGVELKFVKEGFSFSKNNNNSAINNLLISLLGAISQFEREIMLERQRDGIKRAQKEGLYKGRKAYIDRQPILEAVASGKRPKDIKREFKISNSYLYKIISDEKRKKNSILQCNECGNYKKLNFKENS